MKKTMVSAAVLLAVCLALAGTQPASAMEKMKEGMSMEQGAMPGMTAMGRGPAGLAGDSLHHAGKWMLTYKYMYMDMDGNRDGTNGLTTAEVLQSYMVAPEKMSMQMHMLGLMYGVNRKFTLMAMVPYTVLEMDHVTRMGGEFTTKTDGVGDLKAMALYAFPAGGAHRFHLNAGISFPTGSIDERGTTPMGPDQKLPYPMQLGSGTWDLIPGVTYNGSGGKWLWGAQGLGVIRLGENDNDYTFGNRFDATGWLTRLFGSGLSGSVRLDWNWWGNIDGADPELNPMVVPTADPDLRAGSRLDALLGLNFVHGGLSLAVEGGVPVYQDLDGPQLETDWLLALRLQWGF
jgi:hypothetical protein